MLLPELDYKATIEQVKSFFEKDFRTLQNMAHVVYMDIKSPTLKDLPDKSVISNAVNSKTNNYMYAIETLAEVRTALSEIDRHSRKLIEYRYFKQLTWHNITGLTECSLTHSQKLLNDALIEFANAFVDVEDLRVFKDKGG
ncbi:ArpU family phage packaging/lysis transcriptional regulator [Pediococcus pentosaceus]|uniref:ArpU family phage packaging/lysis transcriptional regulator n=1 Tax=Pediococcus pentosaceus TaxID=1255 RepID=UPI00132F665C|nr:ArpU family phage packaging/lysis transcriptional regulator [Pediococcus pentosaceus]KAF0351661.1 RNA polymerase subunit sigma-70 [Pediococcus pentosaceus]MBF7106117.1 RNA polymerase subunit sigma-70 [Pediococcus pentosaceus]MBF7137978.1 RNA polymerase subunit sigma-70 [Pediococcus pentosaceus]